MKTTVDAHEAERLWYEIEPADEPRVPTGEFDFGDPETVGLHLKRAGKSFSQLGTNDFGMFLGHIEGHFVVGIKHLTKSELKAGELFDTIEELKKEWQLD